MRPASLILAAAVAPRCSRADTDGKPATNVGGVTSSNVVNDTVGSSAAARFGVGE